MCSPQCKTIPSSACRLGAALLLAAVLGSSESASASGLDTLGVGTLQSGPTSADPAALAYNPAMLGFLSIQRADVLAGLGIVVGRVGYERERRENYQWSDSLRFKTPLDPADLDASKTAKAEPVSATPVAPLGDIFIAIPLLRDKLVLGAGLYVPYGAPLSFPEQGPHIWQVQAATLLASFISAGASYRVSKHLSLGGGLSYVLGFAELRKTLDFASLDAFHQAFANEPIGQPNDFGPNAPPELRELSALSRPISLTRGISHGISFNVGAAFKPNELWTLGLSYQHGTKMNYDATFVIDMNDPLFTQDLAAQGLQFKPLVKGEASLSFALPKRITFGIARELSPTLRADGFFSVITYSDLDAFTVITHAPDLAQPKVGIGEQMEVRLPRNWRDTVDVGAALRWQAGEKWLVSVGLGYQSPASPDSTIDLSSPDGHRLLGSLGGAIELNTWLTLYLNGRVQGILPRTVVASTNDLGNGRYTLFIGGVGGHLRAKF